MRLTLMCCTENDNKYTRDVENAVPYADQDILTNVGAPFSSRSLTNINVYYISEGVVPRRFSLLKGYNFIILGDYSVDYYRLVSRECEADDDVISAGP